MPDNDQIRVLSKEDFRRFCEKCEWEDLGDGQALSGDLPGEPDGPMLPGGTRLLSAVGFILALLTVAGCGDPDYHGAEYHSKLHPPVQGTYSTGDIPYR